MCEPLVPPMNDRRRAHGLVGQVDPGAGGVHDDVGSEVEHFAGEFIAQLDSVPGGARLRVPAVPEPPSETSER